MQLYITDKKDPNLRNSEFPELSTFYKDNIKIIDKKDGKKEVVGQTYFNQMMSSLYKESFADVYSAYCYFMEKKDLSIFDVLIDGRKQYKQQQGKNFYSSYDTFTAIENFKGYLSNKIDVSVAHSHEEQIYNYLKKLHFEDIQVLMNKFILHAIFTRNINNIKNNTQFKHDLIDSIEQNSFKKGMYAIYNQKIFNNNFTQLEFSALSSEQKIITSYLFDLNNHITSYDKLAIPTYLIKSTIDSLQDYHFSNTNITKPIQDTVFKNYFQENELPQSDTFSLAQSSLKNKINLHRNELQTNNLSTKNTLKM